MPRDAGACTPWYPPAQSSSRSRSSPGACSDAWSPGSTYPLSRLWVQSKAVLPSHLWVQSKAVLWAQSKVVLPSHLWVQSKAVLPSRLWVQSKVVLHPKTRRSTSCCRARARRPFMSTDPGLFGDVLARGRVRELVGDRAWLRAMLAFEAAR